VPAVGLPLLAALNALSATIQPRAHAAVPPAFSQVGRAHARETPGAGRAAVQTRERRPAREREMGGGSNARTRRRTTTTTPPMSERIE